MGSSAEPSISIWLSDSNSATEVIERVIQIFSAKLENKPLIGRDPSIVLLKSPPKTSFKT